MSVGFFSASGAECSLNGDGLAHIWELVSKVGGQTDTPARLGFFGAGGHGTSVLLESYADTVYVVDRGGDLWASGQLVPIKYVDANTALASGISRNLTNEPVPCESGTVLVRFAEPTGQAVQTLNATFRSVALTVDDVVEDDTAGAVATDVIVYAAECARKGNITISGQTSMDGDGDSGSGGDNVWERIDAGGSDNQLGLWNHLWTAPIHDYAICVSIAPQKTGAIADFGFMVRLDYV